MTNEHRARPGPGNALITNLSLITAIPTTSNHSVTFSLRREKRSENKKFGASSKMSHKNRMLNGLGISHCPSFEISDKINLYENDDDDYQNLIDLCYVCDEFTLNHELCNDMRSHDKGQQNLNPENLYSAWFFD